LDETREKERVKSVQDYELRRTLQES